MKKIPTLFVRDDNRRYVTPEVTPGCEWVLEGEGVATLKWDGTCTMLDENGNWWARREVKPGKTPPAGWVEADVDDATGKRMGWEPMSQSPFAKHHQDALNYSEPTGGFEPGTYELVGPKVNGNPHELAYRDLIGHGLDSVAAPSAFDGLRGFLLDDGFEHEGLVWWHQDGRKAKLKVRDFPKTSH